MSDILLPSSCVVSRPAVSNVGGIRTDTFADIGTYRCRLGSFAVGASFMRAGTTDLVRDGRRLMIEASADIVKGDRVTIDGTSYAVLDTQSERVAAGVAMQTCLVQTIK